MSARSTVLDALADLELNTVQGRWPDQITETTLALGVQTVEPRGIGRMRQWTLLLGILTALESEGVDDDLEATLADVLDALDVARIGWTTATRQAVADDAYHAYVVTVNVITQEA